MLFRSHVDFQAPAGDFLSPAISCWGWPRSGHGPGGLFRAQVGPGREPLPSVLSCRLGRPNTGCYRTRVPHLPVCRHTARTRSSAMSTVRYFKIPFKDGVCGKNRAVAPSSWTAKPSTQTLVTAVKSERLLGGRSQRVRCERGQLWGWGVWTLMLATETSCPPLGRGHDSGVPRGQLSLAVAAPCL